MGYFYLDPDFFADPATLDLSHSEFRRLIERACLFSRYRAPVYAIPEQFAHLFKFPARRSRRRNYTADRESLWTRFGGICYLCLEEVDFDEFQIEHVVPISRGGQDAPSNLNIAHKACNMRKGSRLLEELEWWPPV